MLGLTMTVSTLVDLKQSYGLKTILKNYRMVALKFLRKEGFIR